MKFIRLGFVAAMAAMALCGQQALAATAPAAPAFKMDPKIHEQSMKDAPALVQAAGSKCQLTDAYQIGTGEETVAGKKIKAAYYEIACSNGLGYIFKSVPGGDAQFYDCLSLKISADREAEAAAKDPKAKPKNSANTCIALAANADPGAALKPIITQTGAPCASVAKADAIGTSLADKLTYFEAACSDSFGYVVAYPQPGATKPGDVIPCTKADASGVACKLTGKDQIAKQIIALDTSNKHPNCKPNQGRWVVTDAATGNDYYEVGCSDGKTAYMFRTNAKGQFGDAIECPLATRIAGGCQFMNVNTGSTAEVATYTKLAKQIGYEACPNVARYQSYGTENGGPREIVELNCGPTEGGYAFMPTGTGQTGEYFNCVRATGLGLTCHLTPMEATYAKMSQQIAARGKTTCKVSNGRDIGRDDKGVDYVEVACSAGDPQPALVLQYSKLPQETLAQATTCAQAPIKDACTLTTAKK